MSEKGQALTDALGGDNFQLVGSDGSTNMQLLGALSGSNVTAAITDSVSNAFGMSARGLKSALNNDGLKAITSVLTPAIDPAKALGGMNGMQNLTQAVTSALQGPKLSGQ